MINLQSEPEEYILPKPPSMMNNNPNFTSSTSSSSNGGFSSSALNFLNTSSGNINPKSLDGGMNMPAPKSGENFIEKGFNAAKQGATSVATGVSSIVNTAQNSFNDSLFSLNPQRLFYSTIAACVGIFLILMSFFALPFAILTPSWFSFPFTLGSISIFVCLSIMKGPGPLIKHMMSKTRWPFSVAYLTSIVMTLFFTLMIKSYFLVIIFSIAQFGTLFSFLVSYVPGGTQFLSFIGSSIWSGLIGLFRGRQRREPYLPL